ncbi:MAG: WecB/TagA/CpsF family glycosyltransferase [Clostridia bacterium]|nr:WecB/TagA/CpsF family glycosyltransferase [Clostridia bacterium]
MEKVKIRDVFIDNVTLEEAVEKTIELSKTMSANIVITPNAEIAQLCHENEKLKEVVNSAQLVVPDGIGVVMASKIIGKPLKEKVAGYEVAKNLFPHLEKENLSVFFFGSKPGVAQTAAENVLKDYPNLNICGIRDGYFKDSDEIIAEINEKEPNVLFVCLGAPKQEFFMFDNKDKIKAGVMLGLGGSLDVMAGTVKRAPDFFVRFGLEWFYRLMKEPKRIGRMMKLPKYLFSIIFYKLSKGKNA